MNIFILLTFFFIFFALELIYFKIAYRYNIIDKPNHRSSHTKVTIRGGGIIFSVSLLLGSLYFGWQYGYFLFGLFIISLISFIDDIKTISNRARIGVHLIAVFLLFYQLDMYSISLYWIILGLVFVIGTINAINFMDGINGITGLYGLIVLLTLYYINKYIIVFTGDTYLVLSILSLCVFNFFNFRKKAKCFAGDVGSISLAFIILFFLLQLIITANNIKYIIILLMYGLDVVTTIFFRIYRKENIFDAHRTHFYQFLANEKKVPHLWVAFLYGISQLLINYILVRFPHFTVINCMIIMFVITLIFTLIRFWLEGAERLFTKSNKDANI